MSTPGTGPGVSADATRRATRRAMGMLALMTVASFGGPIGIGAVLRGGASPDWPPDRPVEWATLVGVSACVLILMIACVLLAIRNQRQLRQPSDGAPSAQEDPSRT